MIDINLVMKHDEAKQFMNAEYPTAILVEETRLKLAYQTDDDEHNWEQIKQAIKSSPIFAGLYISVSYRKNV